MLVGLLLNLSSAPVFTTPSITVQPVSQSVTEGGSVTFSIVANGSVPLAYQWLRNGSPVGGATSDTYTTPVTSLTDDGTLYSCLVSNAYGSASSNVALLRVTAAFQPPAPYSSTFELRKFIEMGYARCRVRPEKITPERIDRAKDTLYMLLSSMANNSVPLWAIDKTLVPLYENTSAAPLPIGTVDVLNANYRTMQFLTPSATTIQSGLAQVEFSTPTRVITIGLTWQSSSVPVVVQVSSDSLSWTTVASANEIVAAGKRTWVDIDGAHPYAYWRVTGSSASIDVAAIVCGSTPTEIPLYRMNRDDFTALPNTTTPGRPLQYWLDRLVSQPVMRLWPPPDTTAAQNLLVVWRHRHVADIGTMTELVEIPQRWYEAVLANFAVQLCLNDPDIDLALLATLQGIAREALITAWDEERDASAIVITPDISPYTN